MVNTKFISWNVNGLRACMQKGFIDFVNSENADYYCIQETKMHESQADVPLSMNKYFNSAEKKGYSGTAIFTSHEPLSLTLNGMEIDDHAHEGRMITFETESFYLVNVYTPNAQDELKRLDYRMKWEDDLRNYLTELDKKKPVIYCGDLNVAHEEIDLKNPKGNRGNPGFSDEEREKIDILLKSGFTDSFRLLHPDETESIVHAAVNIAGKQDINISVLLRFCGFFCRRCYFRCCIGFLLFTAGDQQHCAQHHQHPCM